MKQGTKSFEAYCEEALALKPMLGADLESLLAQRWVNPSHRGTTVNTLSVEPNFACL